MRSATFAVAAGILLIFLLPLGVPRAAAQDEGLARLSVLVFGETEGGEFVFKEATTGEPNILIPQIPIILNVTFHNNESANGAGHSFTINDVNDTGSAVLTGAPVDTGVIDPNTTKQVEFTIRAMDRIEIGNLSFEPEQGDEGILFYCIPHRGAGMVGQIVLATRAQAAPEKGILLRAYWIGLIGIFSTILWIGISYFIIKSSSPRFTDHKAHLRKGLP